MNGKFEGAEAGSRSAFAVRAENKERRRPQERARSRRSSLWCTARGHGSGMAGLAAVRSPGRSVLSAYDHRPYLRGTIAPIGTSSMGLHGEIEAAGRR